MMNRMRSIHARTETMVLSILSILQDPFILSQSPILLYFSVPSVISVVDSGNTWERPAQSSASRASKTSSRRGRFRRTRAWSSLCIEVRKGSTRALSSGLGYWTRAWSIMET